MEPSVSKPYIPRPCIRRVVSPDPDIKFALELPSGCIAAKFIHEEAAKLFVKKNRLHHEYGKCFFEFAPGKFEVYIEDTRHETVEHADMPESDD